MSEQLRDPDGTPMREVWRIRGSPQEIRPAGWFLANGRNWRIHPRNQRQALVGTLKDIGWIDSVKVNLRNDAAWGAEQGIAVLLDGHCRIEEALKEGDDVAVPLEYYNLSPAEEAEALATLDPLAAMAGADAAQFDALLREFTTGDEAVQAMVDDLAGNMGLVPMATPDELWQGMPEFEQEDRQGIIITVHFETEANREEFFQRIGQKHTDKTKSIWYPQRPEELTNQLGTGFRYES